MTAARAYSGILWGAGSELADAPKSLQVDLLPGDQLQAAKHRRTSMAGEARSVPGALVDMPRPVLHIADLHAEVLKTRAG